MFDLKRPCENCPFRRGNGQSFMLTEGRLAEIFKAPAFQCHKTINYSEATRRPLKQPQQCLGLMAILHKEGKPNAIMQVAQRLGKFNPDELDLTDAYDTIEEAWAAHRAAEEAWWAS